MKRYSNCSESYEAYPEEMLNDCLNGNPCSYGICDECPIANGYNRDNIDDD